MRLTLELFGRVLEVTFGPPDDDTDDDDEPVHVVVDTLSADLTHQGGAGVGFHADLGHTDPYWTD